MIRGPASLSRPATGECPEYYLRYIERVPAGDVVRTLATQAEETERVLRAVPREREEFRPAPEAWALREVVGHLIDTERVFGYRALSFARSDASPLPSMDQEAWARGSNAAERPLVDLVDELAVVRRATVLLFAGLDEDAADRKGIASGVEFTVRCIPWIIAGHELHHVALLREKYGVGV